MGIDVKQVRKFPEARFTVTVTNGTKTKHTVSVKEDYFHRLTKGSTSARKLIRRSFEFLLEREPNTAILTSFDLSVISTYFPEYENEITRPR